MKKKVSKRPYRRRYIVFEVQTNGGILVRSEVIHIINRILGRYSSSPCTEIYGDKKWIRIYEFEHPYGIAMVPHLCKEKAIGILNGVYILKKGGESHRIRIKTLKTTGTMKKASRIIMGYRIRDENRRRSIEKSA